jgi:hypothetical protein
MKEQLERVERLESDMNNVYAALERRSADKVLSLVQQEIAWCKAHPNESAESPDFEKGFIKGLEQAGRFCEQVIRIV